MRPDKNSKDAPPEAPPVRPPGVHEDAILKKEAPLIVYEKAAESA